ncbi:MAG: 3-hydroxyisobutyrate dehydrogenase [Acidimicrobiaceae bacterium]|nr:3-hydroxyisobutyrate dehydrogenase [Acidimicrobiaceae bacterium]MDQ1417948.1 3-hydroxyisobutyrate dehydrogenase [Acidimicrobiaceae bacterium]
MYPDTQTTSGASPSVASVTVIGTGTMGSAITRRLLTTGMTVNVWARDPRAAAALAELGATVFDDPRDAVAVATVVLTLLPTADATSEVMIGRQVVDALAPQAVWVQMGTIGVEATEQLDIEVRARRPDVAFVDAPVSGSRGPAESGQLLVLASGPESAVGPVSPVFDAIGRRTMWLGPAGTGSRMKLVLNTWLAFEVEAAAESAALATSLGIAPGALADAVDGNAVASPLALAKLTKMQTADDRAEFALGWALKDLELMRASVGSRPAPVALAIADRWRVLVEQGVGDLDVSAARLGLGDDMPSTERGRPMIAPVNGLPAVPSKVEADRAGS